MKEKANKDTLVRAVAARTNQPLDDVSNVVETFLDEVAVTVASGHPVTITGFGSWHTVIRAARTARDRPWLPSGEQASVIVPPTRVVRWRPSVIFGDVVAGRVPYPPGLITRRRPPRRPTEKE